MTAPTEPVETPTTPGETAGKPLSLAARRALAEADARRQALALKPADRPPETGGPTGPDPVRYGDWERKGVASDF